MTTVAIDYAAQLAELAPDLVEAGWVVRTSRAGLAYLQLEVEGWQTSYDEDLVECIKEARGMIEEDAHQAALLDLSERGWDVIGTPYLKGIVSMYRFRHGGTHDEVEVARGEIPFWLAQMAPKRATPAPATPKRGTRTPRPFAAVGAPTFAHIVYVPLQDLDDNPWQPRTHYDPAALEELAADIQARHDSRPETLGLLQLPAARQVGQRWQLAYGHRRRRAFDLLSQRDERYSLLPVNVVTFGDEEMATAAWAENSARRDLNAIEEVTAIQKYQHDFGWTQAEIAERLKMDRSTVAKKLSLAALPDFIKDMVRAGTLTERKAAALVPLCKIPNIWVKKKSGDFRIDAVHSLITWRLEHDSSNKLREEARHIVERYSNKLHPHWMTIKVPTSGPIQQASCEGCAFNQIFGEGERRCVNVKCWEAKKPAVYQQKLEHVAKESSIPIQGKNEREFSIYVYGIEKETFITEVLAARCPHIRLDPNHGYSSYDLPGHAGVKFILVGKPEQCNCAYHVVNPVSASKRPATTGLSAEDIERQQRAAAAKAAMFDRAVDELATALKGQSVDAWHYAYQKLTHNNGKSKPKDFAGVARFFAGRIVRDCEYYTATAAQTKLMEIFKELGLNTDVLTLDDA